MRPVVFANGEIYHIYNRGIEKRPTFTDKRELDRAILALDYYRFFKPQLRLSKALVLIKEEKAKFFSNLREKGEKQAEITTYCLMPNHFHFLLKQTLTDGITKFISNFTNSFTKYFNTKHEGRVGPLFQGNFKAIHIEDEKQFLQVHRYIHINPAVSLIVKEKELLNYQWSSLPEYLVMNTNNICSKELVISNFGSLEDYKIFIYNRIDFAKKLEQIKHLILE